MKIFFMVLIFTLSSWSFASPREEVLWGMIYDSEGVTFQVESGGCTANAK